MHYMGGLTKVVEKKVASLLPLLFCLIFDGWSLNGQFTHFVALFASFPHYEIKYPLLLAFSPLLDESDLSANSHKEWIEFHLKVYDKNLNNVICLIGDNMSTNQVFANLCNLPLVGCAAHRFNLKVQQWFQPFHVLLIKVNQLMVKLRTLKVSALLREHTHFRPKLMCITRWSSTFQMVNRYFELKVAIFQIIEQANLIDSVLSMAEEKQLQSLHIDLKNMWSVTLKLQDSKLSFVEVRLLFNKIIEKYPSMDHYISSTAKIIHSPSFELGLIKILTNQIKDLTIDEEIAVKRLKQSNLSTVDDYPILSFAEQALQPLQPVELYLCPSFIPPCSVIVESCFFVAKHIFGPKRLGTSPVHIEEQMFLKMNHCLWDLDTVNHIIMNEPIVETIK